ncbi:MAG: LacI family DNA-binding transcriptional regulator [Eubacteriales bacterium]|jgi:DNA-binding LacI/PurR family transcriptional regulator|nr:LacI family DNA-binding transcriptional regulator [Eubacteriales bacterium]
MGSTIYDIAKIAGVTTATVSLALNNKKGVSQQTKQRIIDIAKELNYFPNTNARSLSTRKSMTVALCISAVSYEYFNSSFYFDIIKYISQEIGNTLFLTTQISTLDKEAETIATLATSGNIMAFVFIGTRLSVKFICSLIGDIPAVFFNKPDLKGKNVYSVSFDNKEAMRLITSHLISLGHQRIAYLGYLPGVIPAENRLEGFKKAYQEANLEIEPDQVIETEYLPIFGYSAIRKILLEQKELPSGLVCGNDLIAVGVMQALREYSFKVPHDISVAGIDNLQLTDSLWVPLTTVDVNCHSIGEEIAHILQQIAEGEEPQKNPVIDVSLIIRESSGSFNPEGKRTLKMP